MLRIICVANNATHVRAYGPYIQLFNWKYWAFLGLEEALRPNIGGRAGVICEANNRPSGPSGPLYNRACGPIIRPYVLLYWACGPI